MTQDHLIRLLHKMSSLDGWKEGERKRERAGSQREKEKMRPKCIDYIGRSLWGKGSLVPGLGSSELGSGVCWEGTEECWETLKARSAMICKMCTSVPGRGVLKPTTSLTGFGITKDTDFTSV